MPSYQEGREARRNGISRDANPYQAGPQRALWAEGWRDSDTILRSLGLA